MVRIKRDGPVLRDQLTQAIAGITAVGPVWPAGAWQAQRAARL